MPFGSRSAPVTPPRHAGHEQHAQTARTLLAQPDRAVGAAQARQCELLKANVEATLAVYDLLREQRGY